MLEWWEVKEKLQFVTKDIIKFTICDRELYDNRCCTQQKYRPTGISPDKYLTDTVMPPILILF